MTEHQSLCVAVDIGGTFTDVVLADSENRILATTKVPTTPKDPADGAIDGATRVLEDANCTFAEVGRFVHGTTLATNALIERRGATVCAVTTDGFRDILEIGYERRYSQYDINIEKPDLIIPRQRCFTIEERVSAQGKTLKELNEAGVDRLVAEIDACEADAVAICLLHSYANDAHERRLSDLLMERRPHLSISLSSAVSPEAREYDRLCTTAANAYIQPLMSKYLRTLAQRFADAGLPCPILMMTASGGMTALENAAMFPIRLVESGPAGGAILAAQTAARCGLEKVLSFDMGGTTAKLCLIDGFAPQSARHFEVSRAARFIKGSGIPVRIPVTEMIEIGAGGGSIAAVDSLGRLTVGPQSAGSDPGPAAYKKGGELPTVTDADVTLGLIDPSSFAEGRIELDRNAADGALLGHVGCKAGMNAAQSADGVCQIVDESMASAGRMHAVESGKELGDRVMIAFGGNGPLHATRVARRSGVDRILVPRDPAVGSAVGFLWAPISFEVARSHYTHLEHANFDAINDLLDTITHDATSIVRMGASSSDLCIERYAFMRYQGQGHEIEVALPAHRLQEAEIEELRSTFEQEYRRLFVRSVPGMAIEILNWLVKVSTVQDTPTFLPETQGSSWATASDHRTIVCDVTGVTCEAAVFRRKDLMPGQQICGPALIVEPQTTTFVSIDFSAMVDSAGNLLLERNIREGKG